MVRCTHSFSLDQPTPLKVNPIFPGRLRHPKLFAPLGPACRHPMGGVRKNDRSCPHPPTYSRWGVRRSLKCPESHSSAMHRQSVQCAASPLQYTATHVHCTASPTQFLVVMQVTRFDGRTKQLTLNESTNHRILEYTTVKSRAWTHRCTWTNYLLSVSPWNDYKELKSWCVYATHINQVTMRAYRDNGLCCHV